MGLPGAKLQTKAGRHWKWQYVRQSVVMVCDGVMNEGAQQHLHPLVMDAVLPAWRRPMH